MDADLIWLIVFLAGIGGILFARVRLSKTKRLFITDYQRGVRYKNGAFSGELGPGTYDLYTPTEQVIVVDMRPQLFVVDRLLYHDALKAPSVISIGAELIVSNAYTACTALKDQINESVAMVRDVMREAMSKSISDPSSQARKKIARDLEAAANAALDKVGMQVSNLEVTELWPQFVQPKTISGAN